MMSRPLPMPALQSDSSESVLADYQRVEGLCQIMLEAARQDDWDRVADLERATRALIEGLRARPQTTLPTAALREKLRIMKRILLIDGELRKLAEPWQDGLARMFAPPLERQQGAPRAAWN